MEASHRREYKSSLADKSIRRWVYYVGMIDWRSKVILLAVMWGGVAVANQNRVVDGFLLIDHALQAFRVDAGRYPTEAEGLKALEERPATYPTDKRWKQVMKKIPTDPWGKPYHYITSPNLERGYGLYSDGKDGASYSKGNDPDDWNTWSEDHQVGYGERDSFVNRLKESSGSFCLAMVTLVVAMAAVVRARRGSRAFYEMP